MIAEIVIVFFYVMTIAIIARAFMSWIPNLDPRNPIVEFIITITEPILAPIRSLMPRSMMIDFSPFIAIIVLQVVANLIIKNIQ